MPFSYQVTKFTRNGGETIFNTDICSQGENIKKTGKEREKKYSVPSLLLAANECHWIMANVRWRISLTVQYNVRHLVLSPW